MKIFFSLLFFMIMSLPLLIKGSGLNWSLVTKLPSYENRTLAQKSDVTNASFSEFFPKLEAWLSDTLPFRKILMEAYMHAWIYGLHSTHLKFILGQEGALFPQFDNAPTISNYLGLRPLSDSYLEKFRTTYAGMQAYCDKHNIKFLLVLVPDKADLEQNKLPWWAQNKTRPSRFEQLTQALSNTGVNSLPILEALLAKEKEFSTYNKRFDINHWNGYGLDCVYEQILLNLQHPFPNSSKPYRIKQVKASSPPWWIDEEVPFVDINNKAPLISRRDLLKDLETEFPELFRDEKLFRGQKASLWRAPDYVINEEAEPYSLILLSDSYIKQTHQTEIPGAYGSIFPLACHVRHFFTTHFATVDSYEHIDAMRKKFKPNFLIEVMVARSEYLSSRMYDSKLNYLGMKKLGESSSSLLSLILQTGEISPHSQSSQKGDLLLLDSPVHEPSIYLPEIIIPADGKVNLVCELDSPADGFSLIFFAKQGEAFSEENRPIIPVKKGKNFLLFSTSGTPGTKLHARFHPINSLGTCSISPYSE